MPHHSAHHRVRLHLDKKFERKLIRRSALAMSLAEQAMTMPQVYQIWVKHQVAGVSFATWFTWTIAALVWLLYGLQIKDKPLIISSSLWFVIEGIVTLGIIVYG